MAGKCLVTTMSRRFLLPTVLGLALLLAAVPATAQGNDNNAGTVKVHDDEDENPDQRNVPHVSCDFWVEGFNMQDGEGWLEFFAWPPTGDKTMVTPDGDDLNWTGEEMENGNFHFLKGPYFLEAGHYRVEVYTEDGHPGHRHFAKAKTFWVEPCEGEAPEIPCPPNVTATANSDGSILIDWDAVADVDGYIVYRAVGEGEFEMIATTNGTEHLDTDTEVGTTYSYYVTAFKGDFESEDCPVVMATAIPFFPTMLVGALALVGSVGAYAWFRRRS